jgi:hypothetical protein
LGIVGGPAYYERLQDEVDQKDKVIPLTIGRFPLTEASRKLTHLPDPANADPNKVNVPFPLKKLVSCPVDIVVRQGWNKRYYPGNKLYKGRAYLGVDRHKRLFFQVGIQLPGHKYIKVTISKKYLFEMLKYHLKLRPIPSIPKGDHNLWFENPKIEAELKREDIENLDPDTIIDEYLAAVANMEKVLNSPCANTKRARKQYYALLALEDKIKLWAFTQACKKQNVIPDPDIYKKIDKRATNLTAFKAGLLTIKSRDEM